ncbi:uncharacterized protein LOC115692710 [Syzygium oleosum]|uniref:uncharacterized protein LOC115692710 n=1 Tax=Syzygium oleosum TaxID=219896 RepID=UPI0024B8D9F4|nr:uncharacterized protein LOC115692710 [Syzygium oleosum]
MSTGKPRDGDLQLAAAAEKPMSGLPPRPPAGGDSNAIVEYTAPLLQEEEEDLEVKLRRIIENVPVLRARETLCADASVSQLREGMSLS